MENPGELREKIAAGLWRKPTTGLAPSYAQANLVILDRKYAFDFLLFCTRNPRPCPILEVLDPGRYEPEMTHRELTSEGISRSIEFGNTACSNGK